MPQRIVFRCALLFCLVLVAPWRSNSANAQEGPPPATNQLKEFSKVVDNSYRFEVVDKKQIGSSRVARLHMVSQKWKDTTWKHVVWVIIPSKAIEKPQDATSRSAILLIDGPIGRPSDGHGAKFRKGRTSVGDRKIHHHWC